MTIKETVREAQDTLTRLNLGLEHQKRLEYARRALANVAHVDPAYPQSLGELCIELAQNSMANQARWVHVDSNGFRSRMFQASYHWLYSREFIKWLRRAMYHRNRRDSQ